MKLNRSLPAVVMVIEPTLMSQRSAQLPAVMTSQSLMLELGLDAQALGDLRAHVNVESDP